MNKEVISSDLPASNAVESKVDSSVESSGCKGPDKNLQDEVHSELVKDGNISTSSARIKDEPYVSSIFDFSIYSSTPKNPSASDA